MVRTISRGVPILLLAFCLSGCGGSQDDTWVEVEQTDGDIEIVSRPETVVPNENESPTLRMFAERTGFELPRALGIDARDPGTYDKNNELPGGEIASGKRVYVYYLHADTPNNNTRQHMTATVEFSRRIAGVIATPDGMERSNEVLQVSEFATAYPRFHRDDGYTVDVVEYNDSIEIGPSRRRLTLDIGVEQTSDAMRVVFAK